MNSYGNNTVVSGARDASGTASSFNWSLAGGQGRGYVNSLLSGQARRGAYVPSIIAGSWGRFVGLPGANYAPAPRYSVLFEFRSSTDGGATWSAWRSDAGWELYFSFSSSTTLTQYRWRMPIPATGYLRVEWDLVDLYRTSSAPGDVVVSSLVVDDCYRDCYVSAPLTTGYGYATLASPPGLSPLLERPRMISGERDTARRSGTETLRVNVTATPVTLTGVALGPGLAATAATGTHAITFSPDNGAAARAIARRIYSDTAAAPTGQENLVGAILDDAGGAVTARQSCRILGRSSDDFTPIYTGGAISSLAVVSGTTATGLNIRQSYALIRSGFYSGTENAGVIARVIYAGTGSYSVSYSPLSAVLTSADKPPGYHPFQPSTWPVTPTFDFGPPPVIGLGTTRSFGCPRFFMRP